MFVRISHADEVWVTQRLAAMIAHPFTLSNSFKNDIVVSWKVNSEYSVVSQEFFHFNILSFSIVHLSAVVVHLSAVKVHLSAVIMCTYQSACVHYWPLLAWYHVRKQFEESFIS